MEEYIITKKNFEKYFNGQNVIDRRDYLLYKKMEKARKIYLQIGEKNYHYFITLVCNKIELFRNVFNKNVEK